jgi:hypothetical protein
MSIKLFLKCAFATALGLLIALIIGFTIMGGLYQFTLNDVFAGIEKYSLGILFAYLILVPLVLIEQIKKAKDE